MSAPRISVCVPTMRVGGIDVLLAGLQRQSFRDFELVLSDALYRYRADQVAAAVSGCDFRVVHVEPRNNLFPLNQFSHVANEAIANARGDLLLFIVDYTLLPPDALAAHAEAHKENWATRGYMLAHDYFDPPAVSRWFPKYGNDQIEEYVADLIEGRLERALYSIFETPLGLDGELPVFAADSTGYAGADPKLRHAPGGIDPTYFHGKNESVFRSAALEVNGWNEDLDGGHCYQDADFAERLDVRAGVTWRVGQGPVAQIINPRRIFPFPRRPRSVDGNHAIWRAAKACGYPSPNKWKLQDG